MKSLSNPGSLPAQDPCQPKIPVIPMPQSTQDPSQPKIPVNPRSQSAQDPSQPKISVSPRSQSAQDPSQPWMSSCLFGSCLFGIWLMPIWYLAHDYLTFGLCLFGIWLMLFYLAHVKSASTKFSNIYYIPTWKTLRSEIKANICQFSKFSRKFLWVFAMVLISAIFWMQSIFRQ